MKVKFCIRSGDTIDELIHFETDWSLPFLPRMGESISPSIVMDKVSVEKFHESLAGDAKEKWDKWLGGKPDEIPMADWENGKMCDWLIDMDLRVCDVDWNFRDGEYGVMIWLEETDHSLKPDCPLCR